MKNVRLLGLLLAGALTLVASTAWAEDPAVDVDETETGEEDEVGAAPNIHGFLVARYMNADGKGLPYSSESQFDMQFVRVNVDGKAHPLVSYLIALDVADVKAANLRTPLREAYVIWDPAGRWKKLRRFGPKLRLGRMRRPGGIESAIDENQLIAMDRSIYSGFLQHDDMEASEQDFRDLGLRGDARFGIVDLTGLGLTNGNSQQQPSSFPADEDPDKDVMGRVGLNFTLAELIVLRAGLSQLAGRDAHTHMYSLTGDVPVKYQTTAVDLTLILGRLIVLAEAARGTRTIDIPGVPGDTATGTAGYVLISWGFGDGGAYRPFTRIAYRELSGNDNDDDFQRPRDWSNEATVGINVQIVKKKLTARGQYTLRSGYIPPHPSTGGIPGFTKKMSGAAGVSIQADF